MANALKYEAERNQVLETIRRYAPITSEDIAKRTGMEIAFCRSILATLKHFNHVTSDRMDKQLKYSLPGIDPEAGRPVKAPTITNFNSKLLYDGLELKPFDGRKGAMDAFKYPSLVGNERLYREEIV